MSHPQHRIRDYAETTKIEAAGAAAHYSDAVDMTGMGAVAGIQTGNWTGYADAFELLQDAAWNALVRRRHADSAARLFGSAR
jgi:hypothetical protein